MNTLQMMQNKRMQEFIRFCIVGIIATGTDAVLFYLVRLFAVYQIALICGYIISLVINYFLTVTWTFNQKPSAKNALGVFAAHMLNLFVVRMGLMWFFVTYLGMTDKWSYLPTLAVSVFTNFFVVRYAIKKYQ